MITVNDREMPWQPNMTLADVVNSYTQYDSLIYINPELLVLLNKKSYSEDELQDTIVEDNSTIILMYEYWGG